MEKQAISQTLNNQELAENLQLAKATSRNDVVRGADLDRKVREYLLKNSYLTEVIKGWYLLTTPAGAGTTTLWYGGFWNFISYYLEDRFGENGYCLSAESSVGAHAAQNIVPKQLVVITKKASNQTKEFLFETTVLLYQDENKFPKKIEKKSDLNVIPLLDAFCGLSASYFSGKPLEAEIALRLAANSVGQLSRILIESKSIASANRIVGALEAIGEHDKAKQILQDISISGLTLKPENPFVSGTDFYLNNHPKITSPYAGRIFALWAKMRPMVIANFSSAPGLGDAEKSLAHIHQLYTQDAYHSLSIEGYQVTESLIQRVRDGLWSSDIGNSDQEQKNALAAKGYCLAFNSVASSAQRVLRGESPGVVFEKELQNWYRELFRPLAQAQLIPAGALAGYRNMQVYISGSRHIPPPTSAVLDSMDALFQLLKSEKEPAVKAILGHFLFVFIHPYMDGNGRIARFLLNLMLISGGYPWVVIRASERNRYMSALEAASKDYDIIPFTKFVESEMRFWEKSELK